MTFTTLGQCQIQRNNIWYFGDHSGLDFTSGSPTALTDGSLYSLEGCASICDTNGDLLFYTNGGNFSRLDTGAVWNRKHQIMPNGLLYGGCFSAIQSAIIIPKPNDSSQYYIFTNDCAEGWLRNGLMYSIVDMTLDWGLGDVVTKNVMLSDSMNEGITAIPHSNGIDFWIVGHKAHTDSFYVYQITSSGIHPPLKQKIGPVLTYYGGQVKASPLGDKIFLSAGNQSSGIFNFDPSSGILSNFQLLNHSYGYGTFSPNGEFLYLSDGSNVNQYNLSATNIPASQIQIVAGGPNTQNHQLQIAPDGKIYIATGNTYLNAINCPNKLGVACEYQESAIDLNGRKSWLGLPNHVDGYFIDVHDPCSTTATNHFEPSSKNYQITPNPFNHSTTLTFENPSNDKFTMILYDCEGRMVRSMTDITTDQIIIQRDNLPNGLFYFQLFTESMQFSSGSLVIKD